MGEVPEIVRMTISEASDKFPPMSPTLRYSPKTVDTLFKAYSDLDEPQRNENKKRSEEFMDLPDVRAYLLKMQTMGSFKNAEEQTGVRDPIIEYLDGLWTNGIDVLEVLYQRFANDLEEDIKDSEMIKKAEKWGQSVKFHTLSRGDKITKLVDWVKDHSITDATILNHYKPFSSEIYGETSFEQVALYCKHIKSTDVFVDMGSGVGHVAIFVAAYTGAKTVGIEFMPNPAGYAKKMLRNYQILAPLFGLQKINCQLYFDSFMDPKFSNLITQDATLLHMNNHSFEEALMQRICNELLKKLKTGVRIIHNKEIDGVRRKGQFVKGDNFINISETGDLETCARNYSWTDTIGQVWMTTVNQKKGEETAGKAEKAGQQSQNASSIGNQNEDIPIGDVSTNQQDKTSKNLRNRKLGKGLKAGSSNDGTANDSDEIGPSSSTSIPSKKDVSSLKRRADPGESNSKKLKKSK